jgi:hypothetical protein
MKGTVVSVLLGVAVCATPAFAGPGSINRAEHREQARIRQGIRSGELTRTEVRRLEAEQARIRVNERFARADGNLSLKERERLHKQLRHASRDIYRQTTTRIAINQLFTHGRRPIGASPAALKVHTSTIGSCHLSERTNSRRNC